MEHAPESWIDERVHVKIFGESEALVGKLVEVGRSGIVVRAETGGGKRDYPDDEALQVLVFVPMSKVNAVLRTE